MMNSRSLRSSPSQMLPVKKSPINITTGMSNVIPTLCLIAVKVSRIQLVAAWNLRLRFFANVSSDPMPKASRWD